MLHILDSRQLGRAGIIAATALETDDGIALFDTGPESTFDNITADLQETGAEAKDVRHVFLSHIHFDHAGAAWRFAELGATVYVHARGARHLIEPAKLVESARRIFGDQMEKLWGRIRAVPEERVRILQDGDLVRVGAFEVRATATPGHTSHHHVYSWNDTLFGGDVAGVRIGHGPAIPPFVPPELDVEAWLASIDAMRRLKATQLYLPHFGVAAGDVGSHLDELEKHVRSWSRWFRDRLCAGDNEAQLILAFAEHESAELRAGGATESDLGDYERADPSFMAVGAAMRYWQKHHPDEIAVSNDPQA